MVRIVIQDLPEDTTEKCLCGDTAIQIRIPVESNSLGGDYIDGDACPFCYRCSILSDSMRPEDLI